MFIKNSSWCVHNDKLMQTFNRWHTIQGRQLLHSRWEPSCCRRCCRDMADIQVEIRVTVNRSLW